MNTNDATGKGHVQSTIQAAMEAKYGFSIRTEKPQAPKEGRVATHWSEELPSNSEATVPVPPTVKAPKPKDDWNLINGPCFSCEHAEIIGHSCDWLLCNNCHQEIDTNWELYKKALRSAKMSTRIRLDSTHCNHNCPANYKQTDKTYVSSDYVDTQRKMGFKLPSHCAGCGGKIASPRNM